MGIVKSNWMRDEERGWIAPKRYVCQACLEDGHLRKLIRKNLTSQTCDYCKSTTRKAAPLGCIMGAVSDGLRRHFSSYEEAGCPYGSDVPEIPSYLTRDALQQIPLECEWGLLTDIADAFTNNLWVEAPNGMWMAAHEHEELRWSWNEFVRAVKYETRFHFGRRARKTKHRSELIEVSDVLPFLANMIRTHRLIKLLPNATTLVRVRIRHHGNTWPVNEQQLGAPPPQYARAGRMNPAGISYFYAAFDEQTALREVKAESGARLVVSQWETTRESHIVDFTSLPLLPSVFDLRNKKKREMLLFLYDFLSDFSQPVTKDGSEHVEYVPTQVVCEYIAQVLETSSGNRIDGLLYPSSVAKGGRNLVVFPDRENYGNKFDLVRLINANEQALRD